jgi:hypothetical protein
MQLVYKCIYIYIMLYIYVYIYIQLIKLAMAQLQEEGSQNVRLPHGGSNPATVKDCKEQIRILDDGFFGWVKAPGLCRSRDEYP